MSALSRRTFLSVGIAALVSGCSNSDDTETAELPEPKADPVPTATVEKLELNLKVGDRFPLMKTVVQELHQASVIGPTVSRTRLELLLTLFVESVEPDRKRLAVRYNRVRYSQDVADEKFDIDSSNLHGPAPKAALPYLGLVGNGFSFIVGPDNQILEPIGFAEFLERCVKDVPPQDRMEVLQKFAQTTADEGIANFVDDSIGLLPYNANRKEGGSSVVEGDTWVRERRLLQPMPLYLKTRYTLKDLSPGVAEIDVLGSITASTTSDTSDEGSIVTAAGQAQANAQQSGPDIMVRGGSSYGSCTIDRGTGLPLKSHVERFLDMTVRLPNGLEFEQRKRTVTTIQAFPQQSAAEDAGEPTASHARTRAILLPGPESGRNRPVRTDAPALATPPARRTP